MGVKAPRLPDIIGFLITVWWRGFESHSCQSFFGLVPFVIFSGRRRELVAGIDVQGAEGKLDCHIVALLLSAPSILPSEPYFLVFHSSPTFPSFLFLYPPATTQAHMPVQHF